LALALCAAFVLPALTPLPVLAQESPADPEPTTESIPVAAEAETEAEADAETPAETPVPLLPGAVTQVVTLPATQDAFISSAFPNTNFGGTQNLNLGWQSNGQEAMRMLLQFDLSAIPDNAVINSARWELFQTQSIPVNDRNMDFRSQFMTQAWSESAVTWNNANFLGGQSLPLGSVPSSVGWQSGDARNVVQAWLSGGQANFGVIVTGDEIAANGRWRSFRSRESGSAPRLVVDFTANCDNVAPTATVQALPQFSPGEFRVFWSGQDLAPSGCQPSGIANFDVEYRINGGAWTSWKTRTQSTDNAFRGIAPDGARVDFRARATDNAGNRGSFTGTQASTTVDSQPPVASMNPLAPVQSFSSFFISWSGTDNLSGIASYDVEFQVNGGAWQPLLEGTLATSFQVTGAQAGQRLGFRARATDNVGNIQTWSSAPQAETTVLDFPLAVLEPIVPAVIKPTSPVTDSITLNWSGVTAPGTTITQYRVFYSFNGGARTLWQSFDGTTINAVFPYLALGLGDGLYTFEIVAVNTLGQETNLASPLASLARQNAVADLADTIQPALFMPIIHVQ
jgi:hypothetical protein